MTLGVANRPRAEALLRALPKWPPRDSLLAATNSLMELREGTAHAKAVAVSPPGRNGGWALGLVGRDLEALAIASANIVAKGELR